MIDRRVYDQRYRDKRRAQRPPHLCVDCGKPTMRHHRAPRCSSCAKTRAKGTERNRDRGKKRAKDARWREKNRKRLALAQADYAKRNPEVTLLAIHRRRGRKRGTVKVAEWRTILADYDGLCAYCLTASGDTMDHVVPLSRGGIHHISNIVPACSSCNKHKSAHLWQPFRWL